MNRSGIICATTGFMLVSAACVHEVRSGRPVRTLTAERAIAICQESVQRQVARRYRFPDVDFRSVRVDDRRGRNDYVLGDVVGRRGGAREDFRFICRVDLRSGRVRSANVSRR